MVFDLSHSGRDESNAITGLRVFRRRVFVIPSVRYLILLSVSPTNISYFFFFLHQANNRNAVNINIVIVVLI